MELSKRGRDWANTRHGRVTVIKCVGQNKHGQYEWECKCDCGETCTKVSGMLQRGVEFCSNRCVLRKTNLRHGMSYSQEYRAWMSAKSRCYLPTHKNYATYGGRGIKMCDEWRDDFPAFYAHVGAAPSTKHTLDRISSNGDYAPGNVRWATQQEQNNNRRDTIMVHVGGEDISLADLARKHGVVYGSLFSRYSRGIRGDELLKYQTVGRKPKVK
jgi:hypothetical protein